MRSIKEISPRLIDGIGRKHPEISLNRKSYLLKLPVVGAHSLRLLDALFSDNPQLALHKSLSNRADDNQHNNFVWKESKNYGHASWKTKCQLSQDLQNLQ